MLKRFRNFILQLFPKETTPFQTLAPTQSTEPPQGDVEEIVVPWWPGPFGDEWDSPTYDAFWAPVEQSVNQHIREAKEAGKTVKLVEPNKSNSE